MANDVKTKNTSLRDAFGKFGDAGPQIDLNNVSDVYFAFEYFYPEGAIYSSDKSYSKGNFYWKNREEFKNFVFSNTGIDLKDGHDRSLIKKAQVKLFDIAEGKTETAVNETTMAGSEQVGPEATISKL